MAAFGQIVSSIGSVSEFVLDVAYGDYGNTVKSAIYKGIEFLVGKGMNKIIPGYGEKFGEKGFDIGT